MTTITEDALAQARSLPDAVHEICSGLVIHEMAPADYILTKREVRDYVASGDIGAARALIQHVKARRENWRKRLA